MDNIAAEIIIAVIPIVGIVMGSVVLFLYIIFNYKQKIKMLEKGLLKKEPLDIDMLSLFSGLFLTSLGAMFTIFFLAKDGLSYTLLSGISPLGCGIGMILFFIIRRKLSR